MVALKNKLHSLTTLLRGLPAQSIFEGGGASFIPQLSWAQVWIKKWLLSTKNNVMLDHMPGTLLLYLDFQHNSDKARAEWNNQ